MRFLGGGIGYRIWHLLLQSEPLAYQRKHSDAKGKGQATYENQNKDQGEKDDVESDGEYNAVFEDLQHYIRDLKDNLKATTSIVKSVEGPKVVEECEEWRYGNLDSVQAIDKEGKLKEENNHVESESFISRVNDDTFDL